MAREKTKKITSIGGQALIEGIMMRGPKKTAISVRMPDGTISTEVQDTKFLKEKYPIFGLPILRGIAGLIDSLSVGFKALNYSAEKAGLHDFFTRQLRSAVDILAKFRQAELHTVLPLIQQDAGDGKAAGLLFLLKLFQICLGQRTFAVGDEYHVGIFKAFLPHQPQGLVHGRLKICAAV